MNKLLSIVAAALLAVGCAANPATGGSHFSLVSQAQARAMGEQTAEHYLKIYGMYRPSSRATQYVQNLCQSIWAATEAAAEPVSCLVLDEGDFNAWATPGYINISRGALPYMHTEAQLASVLAHEAGHLTARHTAQGQTGALVAGALVTALGVYVASQSDDDAAARALVQGASLGAGLGLKAYSRHHESEADGLSMRYLARAGYDARETVSMLGALQTYEAYRQQVAAAFNGGKIPPGHSKWLSTHPLTPERVADAKAKAGAPDGGLKLPPGVQPATPAADPQGQLRYLNAIDGLEFGPARRYGVAGQDYIAFPRQRLVLQLPQGFLTDYQHVESKDENAIGLWRAVHPASSAEMAIQVVKAKAGMNPGAALQQVIPALGNNLTRIEIAGQTAYVGRYRERLGSKVGLGVAFAIPERDTHVLIGIDFPDAATAAREEAAILSSLQKSVMLSEQGARQYGPLQLAKRTIQAGDTLAKLAATLPQGALQAEHLLALNGWTPDTPLVPGMAYKTLVDTNPR